MNQTEPTTRRAPVDVVGEPRPIDVAGVAAARSPWCTTLGAHGPHESEQAGSVIECGGEAGERIGWTVAVNRPSSRDPKRWEVVGSLHPDREPAENHQVYCQLLAGEDPALYGDARYEIVEVRRG